MELKRENKLQILIIDEILSALVGFAFKGLSVQKVERRVLVEQFLVVSHSLEQGVESLGRERGHIKVLSYPIVSGRTIYDRSQEESQRGGPPPGF